MYNIVLDGKLFVNIKLYSEKINLVIEYNNYEYQKVIR